MRRRWRVFLTSKLLNQALRRQYFSPWFFQYYVYILEILPNYYIKNIKRTLLETKWPEWLSETGWRHIKHSRRKSTLPDYISLKLFGLSHPRCDVIMRFNKFPEFKFWFVFAFDIDMTLSTWEEHAIKRAIMESTQSLYISLFSEEKSDVLKEVSNAITFPCSRLIIT